jgi:hypothetical protein
MYPIPSTFHPLSLLHFISLSSTISHHHPLGPPMALKRAISISLFLHVQDTFSCPLACPLPHWCPCSHSLSSHNPHPLPLWSSQDCVLCDNSNIPIWFFTCGLFIALMMEAVHTYETSVYFETTRRYILEGSLSSSYSLLWEPENSHSKPLKGGYSMLHLEIGNTLNQESLLTLFSVLPSVMQRPRHNYLPPIDPSQNSYWDSKVAKRIYRRTSFSLLRECIHNTRCVLDEISCVLLRLHLCLAGKL